MIESEGGAVTIGKMPGATVKKDEIDSVNAAAASKISEDDMKKKLLEAAAASQQPAVAASEENTEDLEDMLDDLI